MATEESNARMKMDVIPRTVADDFSEKIAAERTKNRIVELGPLLVMFALIIVMSVFVQGFFSWINLVALLQQIATPLVLAMGLTFVLLIGSIDLSLEGVMGFTGSIVALLVLNTKNSLDLGTLGILLAITAGTLFGIVSGVLHTRLKIPVIHGDLRDGKCRYRFWNPQLQGDPCICQRPDVRPFCSGNFPGHAPFDVVCPGHLFYRALD